MIIRYGTDTDKARILDLRPQAESLFGGNSYFLVAEETDILGFAIIFHHDIPAPVEAKEAFINLVEVLDEGNMRKGIASGMVQKILEIERAKDTYQVRAYCDIWNTASHRLWHKNGFGISPVKMPDGKILGSFVTYVLN